MAVSVCIQGCGGFKTEPDAPAATQIQNTNKHLVAKQNGGAFSLTEQTDPPPDSCLVAATHAEFEADLQKLMSGNLVVNGTTYNCVVDGDPQPLACYDATSWAQFNSLLSQLMSSGSVTVDGKNYSCITSDGLQPLPCYVVPATTSYQDYMKLILQLMNQGSITVDGGGTYTCIDGSQVQPPACYQASSQDQLNQLIMELMNSPNGTITIDGKTYSCVEAGF
jgi:hypothetical protein